MFLEMRTQCSAVLASLDVKDAFLSVEQREPTLVHTTDAAGNSQSFSLGEKFFLDKGMDRFCGTVTSQHT